MGNLLSSLPNNFKCNEKSNYNNISSNDRDIIREIDNLKLENKQLKSHINFLDSRKTIKDVIDENQIKLTADKLINDKDVNLKYLPDFIERKFYISIIRIFLALIKETCDTTKLSILGHEIDIVLQKKPPVDFNLNRVV